MTTEMPSFQVGFPIDDPNGPWEFVLVMAQRSPTSVQQWLSDIDGRSRKPATCSGTTGAADVLKAAQGHHIREKSFVFCHVSNDQTRRSPDDWHYSSDGAACSLALVRGESTTPFSEPVVLISCECRFGEAGSWSLGSTTLHNVAVHHKREEQIRSLKNKWRAATEGKNAGQPIVALVLHKKDAALLGSQLGCEPTPLTRELFRDLARRTRDELLLVEVDSEQMPLLADALGINNYHFKSTRYDNEYTQAISTSEKKLPEQLPHPDAPYDQAWYVNRPRAEQNVLNLLMNPGAPVVLWGPERFGKTWLLNFLLDTIQAQDHSATIVRVNLWDYDTTTNSSFDAFLLHIASQIVEAVAGPEQWLAELTSGLGPIQQKLKRHMGRHVLPMCAGRLIFAVDRADVAHRASFLDTFVGMFRAWGQNSDELWCRLRLILAMSRTQTEIHRDDKGSPLNTSIWVQLMDFTTEQIAIIAEKYGLRLTDREISSLVDFIGGHPYLVKLVLHRVAMQRCSLGDILNEPNQRLNTFENYLEYYRSRLRNAPELRQTIRRLAKAPTPMPDLGVFLPLQRLGLIVQDYNTCRLRYPLYEHLAE